MYKTILLIVFAIGTTLCHAATYTALGGNWATGGSWAGGVAPPSPGDGTDIVIIPLGVTIDITGTVNFNGTIDVFGNMNVGEGGFGGASGFLVMDENSTVISNSANVVDIGFFSASSLTIGAVTYNAITFPLLEFIAVFSGETFPLSTTEDGVTPVELLFFQAKNSDKNIYLSWATATEENFDYFALERSSDGEHFIEITQIQGMGDSFSRVDYSYQDEFPLIGRSYYRLRSVDFDGYTEIFDYVMVVVEGAASDFMVFPNPISNGAFSIQTNFELDTETTLIIYNSTGGIEKNYLLNSWLGEYQLDGLRPGSYLFRITTNSDVIVKRVLVN